MYASPILGPLQYFTLALLEAAKICSPLYNTITTHFTTELIEVVSDKVFPFYLSVDFFPP